MTVETTSEVFSPQWVEEFSGDNLGCELGRGLYTWRDAGFGSNINNLLNSWVYGFVVEGWSDLALLVDGAQLSRLECSQESEGLVSHGWSCLFSSMPHLCIFNSTEDWKQHLILAGVSAQDQEEADRISASLGLIRRENISRKFTALGVDQRGAKAVMAKILWSSMTPWLRTDMHVVTHVREAFETSPFIAMHVRRGDKIEENKASFLGVEKFLAAAVSYLEHQPSGMSVAAIKGIWVASDDAAVVGEVRTLADKYFPSVRSEDIVLAADGVPGGPETSPVTTHSDIQDYASFVYLMADLEQLAAADVFVGTCSSNIGRLVMLLRDNLGKEKNSGISLDGAWNPMRQRSLALD
ncbi:unnamed protein product [Laminaria digitata]